MRTLAFGNVRVFSESDSRSVGIRACNLKTGSNPFELYLNKYFRFIPDFNFYESTKDDGREIRLSARWLWFSANIRVWSLPARENGTRFDDRDRLWGWCSVGNSIQCGFGRKRHHVDVPFVSFQSVRREVLSMDRSRTVWVDKKGLEDYTKRVAAEQANSATFGYRYEMLNGRVQLVKATVRVERHVVRRTWLPFRINKDAICVTFSSEVGPERGSWKGGVTGCGWTMKRGESAVQCLRRMERERRFER